MESSEALIEAPPNRRSVMSKRRPMPVSTNRNNSTADLTEDQERIFAVSEASDTSAEYSPKKIRLEPVIYKKKQRKGKKNKKHLVLKKF